MPIMNITTTGGDITNDLIWQYYNTSYATTTTTISNSTIWGLWNNNYFLTYNAAYTPTPAPTPDPEAQARAVMAREERDAARTRAEELLSSLLSEEERACWHDHGYIPVVSSRGRNFRLLTRYGHVGNVQLCGEDGEPGRRFCVHPAIVGMPDADHWLAQKLGLEADEDELMTVANRM